MPYRASARGRAGCAAGIFGFPLMSSAALALENAAIERVEGNAADVEQTLDALVARIENT